MSIEQLRNKLSLLYGLPCVRDGDNLVIKGPKGHTLVSIGLNTRDDKTYTLFGIRLADGIFSTFHSVEK